MFDIREMNRMMKIIQVDGPWLTDYRLAVTRPYTCDPDIAQLYFHVRPVSVVTATEWEL